MTVGVWGPGVGRSLVRFGLPGLARFQLTATQYQIQLKGEGFICFFQSIVA